MPQVAYTLSCPPDPFEIQAAGGNTVSVSATVAITVNWDPGATSTITAETQAKTPGGVAAVDSTLDLYLIVAQVGLSTLMLVKLADALASGIDTLLGGAPSWGIIGELTHNRVREHQQAGDAGLSLSLLLPMAHDDVLVGTRREISLNDTAGTVVITAADDPADNRVDYNFDVSAAVLGAIRGTGLPNIIVSDTNGKALSLAGAGTLVYYGDTSNRVLSLWNGTTNNGPPAGWQNLGFNDAGWHSAVHGNSSGESGATCGGDSIWNSTSPASATEQNLFRHTFTLPAGTITSASITYGVDDELLEFYINGTSVAIGQPNTLTGGGPVTFSISPSAFTLGASNVIAFRVANTLNPNAWLCYALTINTPANTPPAGWQNVGFDDSTWVPAVVANSAGESGIPAGAQTIWASATPTADTENCLFRQTVTLPAGTITAASITYGADDKLLEFYINGVSVAVGQPLELDGGATHTATIATSLLTANAPNLIAARVANIAPANAWWAFSLAPVFNSVGGAGSAGGTLPTGTEGVMLIWHSGAWVLVPAGTTLGQKLTWQGTGTLPAWA